MAERREIGIAAAVDRKLRTGLYAGVALPTHIGFDVEGAPIGGVDMHDVGWTDIDTMPTAVATRHVNEGRHGVSLSPLREPMRGLSSAGHARGHPRIFLAHRPEAAGYSSSRLLRLLFFPERQQA